MTTRKWVALIPYMRNRCHRISIISSYVIMENLRHFLHPYDPEAPVYFGYRFRATYPHGYMSGGAGYVLSRDALRRLNLVAFNSSKLCPLNMRPEDKQIGYCLINVGVVTGDSRDETGRERFLPLNPRHLIPEIPQNNWLHKTYFFKPHVSESQFESDFIYSDLNHFTVQRLLFRFEHKFPLCQDL